VSLEWVAQAQRDHILTSWSKQSGPDPMVVVSAEGCWFTDSEGNRYLDFMSQLVNMNLGHQHPRLIESIKRQADTLAYIAPNFANEARSRLALDLADLTPGDLTATFFTTGGAAANEAAMKVARQVTGRHKIVTRYRSYHGASAAAMTASGDPRRWGLEPFGMPGIVRMLDPYVPGADCTYHEDDPRFSVRHFEEVLQYENPNTVAAIMLETVTGTNGPIVPPDGYLEGIREVCDRYGIMMICDEVMVGFGRLGTWFGVDRWDIVPDILTLAKGLNSGYVPLGAMVVREHIRDFLRDHVFSAGLTYSGHPLACATAVESIQIMKDEKIIERAAARGEYLMAGLQRLKDTHPSVGRVRGVGLMLGLDLVKDAKGTALVPFHADAAQSAPGAEVVASAKADGVFIGRQDAVIRMAPPLVISEEEIDIALAALDRALEKSDAYFEGV
jgi:taurine--2-oxoglutarate transaminase